MFRIFSGLCLLLAGCGTSTSDNRHNTEAQPPFFVYASRFETDTCKRNPFLEEKVVKFWKGYEHNQFEPYKQMFTDSVQLIFPEGAFKGPRDEAINYMKKRLDHISTLQVHVLFWQSIFVTAKKETWVLIWVSLEGGTSTKPVNTSSNIHQVWRFNPAGKVYAVQEYQSQFQMD